jgi:TRAP-type C4-dicarboxylate transport system permease small subunit
MATGGAQGTRRAGTPVGGFVRAADLIGERLAQAGMVLISVFMLLQIVEIAGRKSVGFSILGLSEIGQLLVMSCISLVLPFVFIRDGHIAVEFVTNGLPPRALALLKAVVALASAAFVGALAYFGFGQASLQIAKGDGSPTLGIPIIWYWGPLLLGAAASATACVIQAARNLCTTFFGAVVPEPPAGAGRG